MLLSGCISEEKELSEMNEGENDKEVEATGESMAAKNGTESNPRDDTGDTNSTPPDNTPHQNSTVPSDTNPAPTLTNSITVEGRWVKDTTIQLPDKTAVTFNYNYSERGFFANARKQACDRANAGPTRRVVYVTAICPVIEGRMTRQNCEFLSARAEKI